jgi:hypothetical protein
MTSGSAFWPEADDQLWRLKVFMTISGSCLGGFLGLVLALVMGTPGSEEVLARILGMALAVVGWLAAREVNQIKALLDDLSTDRAEGTAIAVGNPASVDVCLNCGSPAREGLVFCTHCGSRLEGPEHG